MKTETDTGTGNGTAADANAEHWMLLRQLTAHAAGMRASSIGNVVNGVVCVVVLSATFGLRSAAVGFAVLLALIVWRFTIAHRILRVDPSSARVPKIAHRVTANAIALGAFWGGSSWLIAATGDGMLQIFGIALGAGMMSAGPISYRTYQPAALAYLYACAPGCLLGLIVIGHAPAYAAAFLLASYVLVLASNIKIGAKSFIDHHEHERAISKSNDTIQLLLNDYAEQGSDWLIELTSGGRIINACARFAEASARPIETLDGKRLAALLDAGPERDALEAHQAAGRAFRQHVVSLTIDGEQRWWSINARPTNESPIIYRGVVTDITAQRRAEERVSYMAHFDGLTDLPNRFTFGDELHRALKRNKGTAGLMCLDLDQFKGVNDTLGHPIGDQLLQAVSRRIEGCVSKHEIIGRMGGDEFAVLVRANRLDQIDNMANAIVDAFATSFEIKGHDIQIGVSIGIARAPDHAATMESLFSKADIALYAAKAAGRNRAVYFEPGMDQAAEERRQLETDLRKALSHNELRLHYQPIVDSSSGKTTAYEALVRWEHPVRGRVMPNDFIMIAEETGMIVQLGEWVIRQAIDDLATWPDDIGISINLSPAQMRSANLISTVLGALARTQVDPKRVCLEITESVLLHDSEANIETLHKLRALGIGIALDDFGTGYSSLNYLRSFPFDKIKIDRCFVNEIDTREDCRAIVRSVVNLATSLGMTTIAEGVERAEQAEQLMIEGCGSVQGFLYSKAVPADELSNLRKPKATLDHRLVDLEEKRRVAEQQEKQGDQAERRRA
jgi:diguanylate cyclase (GGDEF)-like protein